MRAILDTSVLIGTRPPDAGDELAISTVSLAELHFGVLIAADLEVRAERLRRLQELQRVFDPIPVDARVAASYGLLAARVADIGRAPRRRAFDLMIAATAHAYGAQLVTYNGDDFVGLESLIDIVPG